MISVFIILYIAAAMFNGYGFYVCEGPSSDINVVHAALIIFAPIINVMFSVALCILILRLYIHSKLKS